MTPLTPGAIISLMKRAEGKLERAFDDIYIDVERVVIAHEYVMNAKNKCDYSRGRNIDGLSLALEGEAEYRFSSGERYSVRAGDIIFLPAESAYTLSVRGEYRHYTVNFEVHRESSVMPGIIKHTPVNAKAFKDIFRELSLLWQMKAGSYEVRTVGMVYELIALMLDEMSKAEADTPHYRRLMPAKEYIDKNYAEDMNLEYLASLVDMSVTNFRRLFLKIFGEPPMRYRDKLRLSYAKDYLTCGYYSVSEVAAKCGFQDTSYFIRFFKKNTGATPKEFKNTLRKGI